VGRRQARCRGGGAELHGLPQRRRLPSEFLSKEREGKTSCEIEE
jgi:hypothetical protein